MRLQQTIATRGAVGELCFRRASDFTRADGTAAEQLRVGPSEDAANVGSFEGWACRYGVVDSYGTTFRAGSFAESLSGDYPMLWMHDTHEPIGVFTATDTAEGLWISGAYDPTDVGQRARARAVSGSAAELSVGFVWYAGDPEDENLITGAKLVETSQITLRMAAVPGAQIEGVRELAAAQLDTDSDDGTKRARLAIAQLGLLAAAQSPSHS